MRKIQRDLAILVASQSIYKLIGYAILFALTRHLDREAMGIFFFAASLCGLFAIASELGTNTFLMRRLAGADPDPQRLFSEVFSLRLLLLAGALAAVNGLTLVTKPELGHVVLLTSVYILSEDLYTCFGALFLGLRRAVYNVAAGMVAKLALVAAVMVAVRLGRPLEDILLCYVLANGLQLLVAAALARSLIGPLSLRWCPDVWWNVARESLPFFALAALAMAHFKVDTLMLGYLASYPLVAVYEVAFKLLEASRFLLRPVSAVVFPALSELAGRGRWQEVRGLGSRALWIMGAAGCGLAIAVGAVSPWLVPTAFGPGYEGAIPVLRILYLSVPVLYLSMVGTWLGNAIQRERTAVRITAVCVAANVALNAFAIPLFGPVGAASSTVVSHALLAVWILRSNARGMRHVAAPRPATG